MAERMTLTAELRSETGKGAARQLRREGYVPAVVYGHDQDTRPCKVPAPELEKVLTSISWENTLLDLELDGDNASRVLIREVQTHPFKPEVLHVDFFIVRKGEKLRVEVPIEIVGLAPGVKEGGIMEYARHELAIRCDPDAIPEVLELDVSEMEIGDSLSVSDLQVPEGVEVLDEPSATICAVVPPTEIEEPEEPEEAELEVLLGEEEEGEPEVIGRERAPEEEIEGEEDEEAEEPEE